MRREGAGSNVEDYNDEIPKTAHEGSLILILAKVEISTIIAWKCCWYRLLQVFFFRFYGTQTKARSGPEGRRKRCEPSFVREYNR